MKRSFERLYAMSGFLGMILPILDAWKYGGIPPSISDSYYSPAIVVFTLILGALGITLYNNQGFDKLDKYCNRLAGIAAIGVISFPCNSPKLLLWFIPFPVIHYVSACILFLTFAIMCFVFREVRSRKGETKQKNWRNTIYLLCAIFIIIGMAWAKFIQIYWGEVIALESFGIAYMVQGKVFSILNDK